MSTSSMSRTPEVRRAAASLRCGFRLAQRCAMSAMSAIMFRTPSLSADSGRRPYSGCPTTKDFCSKSQSSSHHPVGSSTTCVASFTAPSNRRFVESSVENRGSRVSFILFSYQATTPLNDEDEERQSVYPDLHPLGAMTYVLFPSVNRCSFHRRPVP